MQFDQLKRREFITLLGGAAAWPLAARAQQSAMPVVGLVGGGGGDVSTRYVTAFHKGLNEAGAIEGQNARFEYHWLEGKYDRLPSLMADLVRRRVAVIATPGSNPASLAAKESWCRRPFVSPCWSIRPMSQVPSPRYGTYRKLHASSGCKVRCSMPVPATRSIPPSQPLCASGPTPFSSLLPRSSIAAAYNLRP